MDIIENYDLSNKHLFKKKAGKAKYYYQISNDEKLEDNLKDISKFIKENNLNFRIYGMHTNLYITDNGFDGLFIDIDPKNNFIRFNKEEETFEVSMNTLASHLVNLGLKTGYDFSDLTRSSSEWLEQE